MADCKESIESYLMLQETIKNNMKELSKECPDKVLKFILLPEYKEIYAKLADCSFTDTLNKKYLKKVLINTCDKLS